MTQNKMPEVGKRYKLTLGTAIVTVLPIITVKNEIGHILEYDLEIFNEIYEKIPESKEEILSEHYISGRGLCFVVKRGHGYKINDTIQKGAITYLITGIEEGREKSGLIVRQLGTKINPKVNETPNSVAIDKEEVNKKIDEAYKLEVEIIKLESDLNCKKALLKVLERNLQETAPISSKENFNCDKVKEAMEELKEIAIRALNSIITQDDGYSSVKIARNALEDINQLLTQ